MKTLLSLLTTVLFSCALIGAAVAQQRSPADTAAPPRGVEGPEIRKETPKGSGKAETPKTGKKGTRARDQQPKDTSPPPRGVEGRKRESRRPKAHAQRASSQGTPTPLPRPNLSRKSSRTAGKRASSVG